MESRPEHLSQETWEFYRRGLTALSQANAPYLVGGAYAFARYTGIERHTKDFDIFCRRKDADRILAVLAGIGCRTEMTFPHWLGKAYNPETEDFIDVIFSSGSGIAVVDEDWFQHAVPAEVLGMATRLCPCEEIIWSKAFVMERERYDGHDVAHLIRACGRSMDWKHLLRRFDGHWRVLLSHVILFGFVYPGEQSAVPSWVQDELARRLQAEASANPAPDRICQGTLISRAQYLMDIGPWGYRDARLEPGIEMTPEDIAHWTRAIDAEAPKAEVPKAEATRE